MDADFLEHARLHRYLIVVKGIQKEVEGSKRVEDSTDGQADNNRVFCNLTGSHMAFQEQTTTKRGGLDPNLEGTRWMQLIRGRDSPETGIKLSPE